MCAFRDGRPWTRWLVAAALAAGVFLVYRPVLGLPFIGDDVFDISANPSVRDGAPGLAYFFSPRTGSLANNLSEHNWRPLATLTFATLAHGRPQPLGVIRFASLVAVWACALLLFFFARAVLGAALPAALAASLFLCHPANVETVVFGIGMRSTLSLAFMLAALLSRTRESGRGVGAIAFQGMCFAAALGFKETAIILPGLIWSCDRWLAQRKMPAWEYGYWTALIAVYLGCRHLAAVPIQQAHTVLTPAQRVLVPLESLLRLDLTDLFWPWSSHPLYHQIVFAASASREWGRLAAAALLWGGGLFLARRSPKSLFACAWIFLALLPTIGVLPGVDYQADRYLFYATAGLGLLAGGVAVGRPALTGILCVLCVGFAVRSRLWLPAYASHEALNGVLYALHPEDPEVALEYSMVRMVAHDRSPAEEEILRKAAAPEVFFWTRLRALYLIASLQAAQAHYADAEGSLQEAEALAPGLRSVSDLSAKVRSRQGSAQDPAAFWPPAEGVPF